jgi:tetratricopeptide (TPR) repeat protein
MKSDVCPVNTAEEVEMILDALISEFMVEKVSTSLYQFTHDTIRKAAISLLPNGKGKRQILHRNLASALTSLRVTNSYEKRPLEKEELKFLLVEHFGAASKLLQSEKEKNMFAKLSLELAEAAMAKSSFVAAVRKLQTGLSVLDESTRWNANYGLTLKIHLTLARLKFCTGEIAEALKFCGEITTHGESEKDKLEAYELIIILYMARGNIEGAFDSTVSALKDVFRADLDEPAEEAVARVRGLLEGKQDSELQNLPTMTHKKAASKLRFLSLLVEISQIRRDYAHQDIAAIRMVEFTLLYGSSPFTALSFSLLGLCLIRRGLFAEAYRFGHLAEKMSVLENKNDCFAVGCHHWAIHYWRKSVRSSLPALASVSKSALDSNDMEHASLFVGAYFSSVLVSGAPMHLGDAMFQSFHSHRAAFGARDSWLATLPFQTVLKLRGKYGSQIDLSGLSGVANDSNAETRGLQYAIFFRMVAAVYFQDCSSALKLREKLFLRPMGILLPYQAFIEGLISTYHIRCSSSNKEKISFQRKASKIIDVLQSWGKKGMKDVAHMTNILSTELHVAVKKDLTPEKISSLYDTAISVASNQGFFHHQALASERAGIHFLSMEEHAFAQKYLSQAFALYRKWGAQGKVEDLESRYAEYIVAPSQRQPGFDRPPGRSGSRSPPPSRGASMDSPTRGSPIRARGRIPGRRAGGRRAPGRRPIQRGGRGPRGAPRGPPRAPPRGGRGRPPTTSPPNRAPGRGRARGPMVRGPGRGPPRAVGNRGPPRGSGRRGGPGRPPPPRSAPPRASPGRGMSARGLSSDPPNPASAGSLSASQTDTTASDETSDEMKKEKKANSLRQKFSFNRGSKKKGNKEATEK